MEKDNTTAASATLQASLNSNSLRSRLGVWKDLVSISRQELADISQVAVQQQQQQQLPQQQQQQAPYPR
jgi:hypothetical protein